MPVKRISPEEAQALIEKRLSDGGFVRSPHVSIFVDDASSQGVTVIETTGAAPPDEVVTYVQRERVPSVRVEGDVAIGYAVPGTVELRTIPNHSRYSYTVINDRRVLVEPGTRKVACESCGGRGEIRMSHGFLTVARPCPRCLGQGQINKSPCKACRGEARVRTERLLSVRIPPGIEDGMQLRLTGEGSGGLSGGPPGDLYVAVHVAAHTMFSRTGSDLYCELPVSFPQLALGAGL